MSGPSKQPMSLIDHLQTDNELNIHLYDRSHACLCLTNCEENLLIKRRGENYQVQHTPDKKS